MKVRSLVWNIMIAVSELIWFILQFSILIIQFGFEAVDRSDQALPFDRTIQLDVLPKSAWEGSGGALIDSIDPLL